jgi:hypothetical protein
MERKKAGAKEQEEEFFEGVGEVRDEDDDEEDEEETKHDGTSIRLKTNWFKRVEENGEQPIVIVDPASGHLIFEPLCLKIMQLFYTDEPCESFEHLKMLGKKDSKCIIFYRACME